MNSNNIDKNTEIVLTEKRKKKIEGDAELSEIEL